MNEQLLREMFQKAQLKIEDANFEKRLFARIDLNEKAAKRKEWVVFLLTTFGKVALIGCVLYYLKNITLPPGLMHVNFEKVYELLISAPSVLAITSCLIGLTMGFLVKKVLGDKGQTIPLE